MGNTSKKTSYGKIELVGLEEEYFTGSIISGTANVESYTTINTNKLKLEIIGIEYVKVENYVKPFFNYIWDNNSESTHQSHRLYYDKYEFKTEESNFLKGQYKFKFDIPLPLRLPSIFEIKFKKGNETCYAGIQYEIKATIACGDKRINVTYPIKIKERYLTNYSEGFGPLERISNGNGFISRINKRRVVQSDHLKTTITYDNSQNKDKIKSFDWKTELNIKINIKGKQYDYIIVASAGSLNGTDKCEIIEKETLMSLNVQDPSLSNAITFKGKMIDIDYILKIYVVKQMFLVFNKKEKICFPLKLLNYVPDNYVFTDDCNYNCNMIYDNIYNNGNHEPLDIASDKFINVNKINSNTRDISKKLPIRDDKVSIYNENINANRGFDYPSFSDINQNHIVSNHNTSFFRTYTLPLKKQPGCMNETDPDYFNKR